MELRHLRYFAAVAEELHFRRAAETLHVAQPAVSEQIRKLEGELGVRLLNRTHRDVTLTDAGAAFLPEVRRVLQQAEHAAQVARMARAGGHARLRIGYVRASLPASVSQAVEQITATMPNLHTSLEPGGALDLLERVRAEALDAAIVSLPATTKNLRVTSLGAERLVAALPREAKALTEPSVRLEALAPERIVVFRRDSSPPFYDATLAACRAAGISPEVHEVADGDVERLLLAVAAGAGVGLVPESIAERYVAPGIRFVALDVDLPDVPIAVVTRMESAHMPTAAFIRAAYESAESRAGAERTTPASAVA